MVKIIKDQTTGETKEEYSEEQVQKIETDSGELIKNYQKNIEKIYGGLPIYESSTSNNPIKGEIYLVKSGTTRTFNARFVDTTSSIPMDGYGQRLISEGTFTNSFDITGLNGDSDEIYLLVINHCAGAGQGPAIRFNDDNANNYGQSQIWNNKIGTIGHNNAPTQVSIPLYYVTPNMGISRIYIYAKSGTERFIVGEHYGYTTTNEHYLVTLGGYWTNTADNITKLNIVMTGAVNSGIYKLYKLK
jgi:hypothetical protein